MATNGKASTVGRKSKNKGSRGERDAVKFLKSLGFADAERTAQHCGKDGEVGDVRCPESLPLIHFEVKRVEGMDLGTKALEKAWAQACRDCPKGKTPALLWRPNGKKWRLSWADETGIVYTVTECIGTILDELNTVPTPA